MLDSLRRLGGSTVPLAALIVVALATSAAGAPQQTPDTSPLDHPARSDDDRYRDQGFKPLEVYAFLGVTPGMVIGDLMPSRGYHTVLLSSLVGGDGEVVAILAARPENEERRARRTGFIEGTLTEHDATNVSIAADLTQVPDDSLDMLLTVRNYHDLGEQAARLAALPELRRVLKPGATLAVIDAFTDVPDERDESVHRINDELAKTEITSGGFEFVDASDLLYNAEDTYDFDGRERAGVRGATQDAPIHRYFIHRWVHKYRKPRD